MYTDVIGLKANDIAVHDTLLEIKSDIREIKNYLLKGGI